MRSHRPHLCPRIGRTKPLLILIPRWAKGFEDSSGRNILIHNDGVYWLLKQGVFLLVCGYWLIGNLILKIMTLLTFWINS